MTFKILTDTLSNRRFIVYDLSIYDWSSDAYIQYIDEINLTTLIILLSDLENSTIVHL